MSPRKHNAARCDGCGLHENLCACQLLPSVELSTRVVIVQHVGERHKPTNTGRLAHRMLRNSEIVPWPDPKGRFDEAAVSDTETDYDLIFLRDDARELESTPTSPGRKRALVVLDGTWHQCSRMSRRVPIVRDMPCRLLQSGPPSIWTVRKQHDPRGLSTFEAVLRALQQTGPSERLEPLQRAFEIVTARMLFLKGRLPSPEVPATWPRATP